MKPAAWLLRVVTVRPEGARRPAVARRPVLGHPAMARYPAGSIWPPPREGQWFPKMAQVRSRWVWKLTWTISRVAVRRMTTCWNRRQQDVDAIGETVDDNSFSTSHIPQQVRGRCRLRSRSAGVHPTMELPRARATLSVLRGEFSSSRRFSTFHQAR